MAFNQNNRTDNENKKFVETSDGDTAVRISLADGITLSEGSSLEVYDHRGFLLFSVDEVTGDLKIKGEFIKI